jgi:hypothetical protein
VPPVSAAGVGSALADQRGSPVSERGEIDGVSARARASGLLAGPSASTGDRQRGRVGRLRWAGLVRGRRGMCSSFPFSENTNKTEPCKICIKINRHDKIMK